MSNMVLSEQIGRVVIVTLNRPERHNSLVPELLQEMISKLKDLRTQPEVRCMVLRANGRSFSTGGDVRGFYENLGSLDDYANNLVGLLNQVIMSLIELPIPVVAAVHGIVTGGSLGFVLASDIVLVAPEASFTPYYSAVGFSPDGGWTALLPAIIGPKKVAEILMLNQTITAEQAVDWGLANRIISAERIYEEALSMAHKIAAQSRGSVRIAKRLLSEGRDELTARLETERSNFVEQITTEEAHRGMQAFLENLGKSV
ncbi:MAG: enoyl-CoA hydratase/isomerase family protein [Anaerolineales bacterium]|nr:enoyl-CoA hydratase/isomerase family protein [Anaerolineales bacterium]